MSQRTDILFPVGRLVAGSLTKPQTTDMENRPLTVKSGPNAGQPRVDYYFAVAIPKGAEQSWAQTEWGQKIYATGVAGFPGGQANSPTFAWKVKDGDSNVPNVKGKKPCDQEGYPGHWIVSMSSGFAPKTFSANGQQAVSPDSIKLGHYVQVFGSVGSNDSQMKPGVFINHNMLAHAGFGPEIYAGPDPTSVGFGGTPLPAGASATPLPGMASAANVPAAAVPAAAALPGMPAAVAAPAPTPIIPVVPNAGILTPPAPVAHQMTAKAQGATYEAMVAAGWSDALLVEHGMMLTY
jgi:hypothetical protein